jgi:hypothetical protein
VELVVELMLDLAGKLVVERAVEPVVERADL